MTREEFQKQLRGLVKNYQPAPDVLNRLGHLTLLMIIGPSGVGKTTIMHHLGLTPVVGDTTRPPRPGEVDGDVYNFRQDYDQVIDDIKAGRFVQIAPFVTGDLYATKDTSYPESGAAAWAVMVDAVPIFRSLGFHETISAFITPPTYSEWMRRLANHQAGQRDLDKRLTEAKRSLAFALNDPRMHFIDTEVLAEAVQQTRGLLDGKIDEAREQKARQAAEEIYRSLN